jgi:two-component system phosphate regulon sensor histidine kinase PhoR
MGPPNADRLWQLTVEHSPVGMTLVGLGGELLTANRALCAMLGYTEAELRASTWHHITHPADLPDDEDLFLHAVSGRRTSFRVTKRFLHADGSEIWGDLSAALVTDDDGAPRHFVAQIVDVTAQRLDQAELRRAVETVERQRRTAQTVLDTVDVGLLLIDADGRYQVLNRRHHDFMDLAFPDGHAGRAGQLGAVYAADGVSEMTRDEMPSIRAVRGEEFDDVRIWVGAHPHDRRALAVSARSLRAPDGTFAGAALSYHDVTDLVRAVRSREEFVASVSHELRTPLSSVLGHLEILLDDEDLESPLARRLGVVQRNAVRLRHLVADLLGAQQRDGVLLAPASTDLAELVREALDAVAATATVRDVTLEAHLPAVLVAEVDADRVRQVVDNLVSNALKYTDQGGSVVVRLEAAEGAVRLVVSDTGIGIAPEEVERVFEPYFRAGTALERLAPGIGLGLGIARDIVVAHGGTLTVGSEPGRGSEFTVTLPVEQPPRP